MELNKQFVNLSPRALGFFVETRLEARVWIGILIDIFSMEFPCHFADVIFFNESSICVRVWLLLATRLGRFLKTVNACGKSLPVFTVRIKCACEIIANAT